MALHEPENIEPSSIGNGKVVKTHDLPDRVVAQHSNSHAKSTISLVSLYRLSIAVNIIHYKLYYSCHRSCQAII